MRDGWRQGRWSAGRVVLGWMCVVAASALPALVHAQDIDLKKMTEHVLSGQDPNAQQSDVKPEDIEVAVTPRGTIEMHVSNVPLSTVLQALAQESRRNIVASPAVTGTVTASLYDVDFDQALTAILKQNGAGYVEDGAFLYVYTNEELAKLKQAPVIGRVFALNYLTSIEAEALVKPLLSEAGKVTSSPAPAVGLGGNAEEGGGQARAGGDYVFVVDHPDRIEEVARVLSEMDAQPRQVLIEATILRASLSDNNSLGIDFTLVGGVDLEMLGSTSQAVQNINPGALPVDRFERFNSNLSTSLNGSAPSGGVTLGIVKDHVAVFLKALEEVTDTAVIANPKMLVLNKQKGQVIVGRRDGYLTTTFTDSVATQKIEFLETGTQLIFRPFIADDGFIRVEIHPEDSTGGVNAQGLPFEQTTEVTSNVLVRDGHTILIGGLFRELSTDKRFQVPGLGSIPVLGNAFRRKEDALTREEVIILLTVHLVKDYELLAKESKDTFDSIERIRVGLRQGMMWHGRERLAQDYYRRAVDQISRGDRDKALWWTNLALHNNERMLPAILLKEKLTGQRAWEDEGASTRQFLQRLIHAGEVRPTDSLGRPAVPDVVGPEGLEVDDALPPSTQAPESQP